MLRLLLAIDGSAYSARVIEHVLQERAKNNVYSLVLLNVQLPIASGHARMFVSQEELQDYYREEGLKRLASAQQMLDAAGQEYETHVVVGHPADCIIEAVQRYQADRIVMGIQGHSALGSVVMGSAATEVVRRTKVPVLLVP